MDRRGFIGSLAAAAAALVLDPEKQLWRPEQKTIFIPKAAPVLVPEVSTPASYYGWVQTHGEVSVRVDRSVKKYTFQNHRVDPARPGMVGISISHAIFVRCGEDIPRGSFVTWKDNELKEVRVAGSVDEVIGVKL